MKNCEVITKTDIGSVHRFVKMIRGMNKRLVRLKTITQNTFKTNIQKVKGMKKDLY